MAIPLRPGVYHQETDNSISMIVGGLGAIAVPMRLDKGEIDRPLSVTDSSTLRRVGGKPIPQYNTEDWAYVDNMFYYTSNVLISRVEDVRHDYKAAKGAYTIPCENAQSLIFTNGSAINVNNKFNMQCMMKSLDDTDSSSRRKSWVNFLENTFLDDGLNSADFSMLVKNSLQDVQKDIYKEMIKSKTRKLNSASITLKREGDEDDKTLDNTSMRLLQEFTPGSVIVATDVSGDTKIIKSMAKVTNLMKAFSIYQNYLYDDVNNKVWKKAGSRVFKIQTMRAGEDTGFSNKDLIILDDSPDTTPFIEIGTIVGDVDDDANTVDILYNSNITISKGDLLCVLSEDEIKNADGSFEREKIINAINDIAAAGGLGTQVSDTAPVVNGDYTMYIDKFDDIKESVVFEFVYLKEPDSGGNSITPISPDMGANELDIICYPSFNIISDITLSSVSDHETTYETELFRVIAKTPGRWADRDNIEVMVCPVIENKIGNLFDLYCADYFDYKPEPGDTTKYATDQVVVLVWADGSIVERYIASVNPSAKDPSGSSKYIGDLVNMSTQFAYIGFNEGLINDDTHEFDVGELTHYIPTKTKLLGGNSSQTLYPLKNNIEYSIQWGSVQAVKEALRAFEDKSAVSIEYVADGAFAGQPQIKDAIVRLCALVRRDCVACLGPKSDTFRGVTYSNEGYDRLKPYLNWISTSTDNQFAAFYANTKMVYDSINDMFVWISCSSDALGLNARVDRQQERWYAVAGSRRGVLTNVIKLGWYIDDTHREYLTKDRFNPIIYVRDEGNMIYDTMSMCALNSDLSEIYNRKTLNYLQLNTEAYLRKVNFEFNDSQTRMEVVDSLTPFFRSVYNRRGLAEEALIQCDESNNPASVVEQNLLYVDISLKLQHIAKRIVARWRIEKASATLEFVQEA